MATNIWQGTAAAVAQVSRGTITTDTTGHTYTVTLTDDQGGTAALTYTLTGTDTTATIAAASFAAAWNASNDPYISQITASASAGVVTLTAKVAGAPFSAAYSADSGGAWSDTGTTTASSGPNDLGLAANWSLAALPTGGVNVVIPSGSAAILYGLGAISAVNIGGFYIDGHSARIGRYVGSKLHSLRLNAPDAVRISGTGSLVALDIGAAAIPILIDHTGNRDSGTRAVVNIVGSAITDVTHVRGQAGIASAPGQTSTVTGVIRVLSGELLLGSPTSTVTTTNTGSASRLVQTGGTTRLYSRVDNQEISGTSTVYDHSASTIASCKLVTPAVLYPVEATTYTAIEVGGTLDCTRGVGTVTLTAADGHPKGIVIDSTGRLATNTTFALRNGAFLGDPARGGFELRRPPGAEIKIAA